MSLRARALRSCVVACAAPSCAGAHSALEPAGRDAERIATLFLVMAIGAAVVWLLVVGCALYSVLSARREHPERPVKLFVIGGGVLVPTLVLAVLLSWGLAMLPDLLEVGPPGAPQVRVAAEQWWWRVAYERPDGTIVEAANEVRFPVGRRVTVAIESPDVVHSFWIPALAGKVDAIPGRTTHLGVEATKEGVFPGICAEYCGLSHALMRFSAVAMEESAYDEWLARQAEPAAPPSTEIAARGARAFLAYGCGACHAVRGTPADGRVGPDLTHVGGRATISGVLQNDVEGFRRWLVDTEDIKPGVHMPEFDMLPEEDVLALAAWLESLK